MAATLLVTMASTICVTGSLHAQETLAIRVCGASTASMPAVRLEVRATFADLDYAFASARFFMEASNGVFIESACTLGSCDPYPLHGDRVVGPFVVGQLHLPPLVYADSRNPIIVLWTRWRPDGAGTEDILITTSTGDFSVFPFKESGSAESRIDTFVEGAAIIRVRRCYADCDGTDDLDLFDFLCFQNAFATDDYYADCDASGALDFFDFLCFQNEFAAGCG